MRDKAKNKMLTTESDEPRKKFPDTAPDKLRERLRTLRRRRAKNKMRRETQQKQRS